VSHKYSGVACSYNSKNAQAGWPELPQRQLSLFKIMIACRHTTVPEMFSALATKIMFWALARVIFSTAKIISWSNKLCFHGLPSKLLQLIYFRKLEPSYFSGHCGLSSCYGHTCIVTRLLEGQTWMG
jgi:hypothetical protein